MSYAVTIPTRTKTFVIILRNFASRRSCLFFFGLLLMAILAATDSFEIMYNVLGITEESKIYPAVMAIPYLIVYVTYLHIATIPVSMRNLAFLFTMLVFTMLFRLVVFCTLVAIENRAAAAICTMIGCLIVPIMILADFFFFEWCQNGAVEVMEHEDEEIILA